eukprot:TRINITY_DN17019_c0_g1_i1.p1 TRINITY_DN17019_c0_g1~~TRINITY_DN17019_c0_g1_i1.p1  ORF type:complete len:334 (+),score=45.19 TRINITY_DN17019_c0_g1_i1:22-1023(+)
MFRMTHRRPQYFLMTLTAMAVVFMMRGIGSNESSTARRCRPKGGLVIDAGSTGTRAHIFQLSGPSVQETFIPAEGFAFADGVKEAVEPLLQNITTLIPLSIRHCTPAIIGATAGLRKLGEATANDILSQGVHILKNSGFDKATAHVLTGQQEGRYAWITVNTLMGTIKSSNQYGIIDVGGGSFQIAFRDEASDLVVESAMGFGVKEALKQLPECVDFSSCVTESLLLLRTSELKEKLPPFGDNVNFFAFSYFFKVFGDSELPASHYLFSTSADDCEESDCLQKVAYLHSIIRYLEIPESSTIRIAKKIDGRETAWPLGALMEAITSAEVTSKG